MEDPELKTAPSLTSRLGRLDQCGAVVRIINAGDRYIHHVQCRRSVQTLSGSSAKARPK